MSVLGQLTSCGRAARSCNAPRVAPTRHLLIARAAVKDKAPAGAGSYVHPSSKSCKTFLEALESVTVVVADTGELELVKKYRTVDCTTNPSLVYRALSMPGNRHYLEKALLSDKRSPKHSNLSVERPFSGIADQLSVDLGCELLKVVPGRVSTEVDVTLSYSVQPMVDKALRLMDLYAAHGFDPSRIYIKLASTWEGIEACRRLEKQGINCNMTLLFTFAQAAGCADAGATLISPFVARIMDWYKAKEGRDFGLHEHPGVLSVRRMYCYFKAHRYQTLVMPASLRTIGEVQGLAGVDKMTISPQLLDELGKSTAPLERKLRPETAATDFAELTKLLNERHGADEVHMMEEKVKQGVDQFAADQAKLEDLLTSIAAVLQNCN